MKGLCVETKVGAKIPVILITGMDRRGGARHFAHCDPKRQRTAALQDADARSHAPENAKHLGVRLSSAAFWSERKVLPIVRHHTSGRPETGTHGVTPPTNLTR